MTETGPAKKSRFLQLPFWATVLVLLLLGLALFGDKGVLRALQYRRQKADLENRIRSLEATNAALRKEIEALRSDRRYLENLARRELGMVKKDELIYQFPSAPGKKEEESPGKTGTPPSAPLPSGAGRESIRPALPPPAFPFGEPVRRHLLFLTEIPRKS
jgi:cell division protein FtsB